MQSNNGENDLSVFVANLNEEAALASVEERLSKGDDPFAILDDCQKGLQWVGERYEQGTYYISGLIMAGEIMRLVGEKVLPLLEKNIKGGDSGLIILGTVQGDIHFLGKDIVKVLLKCYGFTVSDLGVDVPPDEFLASTRESRPDIVGLSCLLNTSFEAMRETIALLRSKAPSPQQPPIYIIGGLVDEQVRKYAEADYWASDAMMGVRLCQLIMKGRGAVLAP